MMPDQIPLPDAVLFDLDGTLADTLEDIRVALNAARTESGLEAVDDPQQVRAWIGRGARILLACSIAAEPDAPEVDALLAVFRKRYPETSGHHARLYPGVPDLLRHLHERGVPLGVVTNKPRRATKILLRALGVRDRFEVVLCPEDVGDRPKPDPAMLLEAAGALGVPVPRCLLVGDGLADVEAAHRCEMPVAAVLSGFSDAVDLRAAAPDWTLDATADLRGRLAG